MNFRKNETQLVCIAKFYAVAGKENQLIERLHGLSEQSHLEGGCIRYELNQNVKDPRDITYIEKWYDQVTFDAHCAKSYIVEFFNGGKPEFVEKFDVSLHKEILR